MLTNEELSDKLEKAPAYIKFKIFELADSVVSKGMDEPCTAHTKKSTWTPDDYRAACHQLGYNPFKLEFIKQAELTPELLSGYSEEFKQGAKKLGTMCTYCHTGVITVITDNVPENEEKPLLAHEIFHAAFFSIVNDMHNPINRSAFEGVPPIEQLLMEYTHLTIYCTEHVVKSILSADNDEYMLGLTEILSTIAEIHERTGHLPKISTNWLNLYKSVRETAVKIGTLRA